MNQEYKSSGVEREGIAAKVAKAFGPLYERGSGYQFVTQNVPTYFATDLVIKHKKPEGYSQNPLLAVDLGCGNGRDIALLASCGFNVMPVDASHEARKKAISRLVGLGLAYRLRGPLERIENVSNLPDDSIDLALGVSSHHYQGPDWLQKMLKIYSRKIKPEGNLGLALKTKNASWPSRFVEQGRQPDVTYDLSKIISSWDDEERDVSGFIVPDDQLLRLFYSERQLKAIFEASGFRVVHSATVPLLDYDVAGDLQWFAWVIGTPRLGKLKKHEK